LPKKGQVHVTAAPGQKPGRPGCCKKGSGGLGSSPWSVQKRKGVELDPVPETKESMVVYFKGWVPVKPFPGFQRGWDRTSTSGGDNDKLSLTKRSLNQQLAQKLWVRVQRGQKKKKV